ncbi:MAG: SIMPL domain-containing protein [Planctomycetota bacterium]
MVQVLQAIVIASVFCVQAANEPHRDIENTPCIEVSGTGELKVVPDEVVLTFGVETQDLSLDKAKAENDTRTRKILSAAKELKIESKDIQTDYVRISPEFDHEYSKSVFKGYEVTMSIQILLRDTSKYDELVAKALTAGANRLHSVDFRSSEARKHREEARRLALLAARTKAEKMAATLECSIGKPLSIIENRISNHMGYSQQSNMVRSAAEDSGEEAETGQGTLALGCVSIKASVSVRFEISAVKPDQDQ